MIKKDNIRFTRGSIFDLRSSQNLFCGLDFVFHHTALPSVLRRVEDPLPTNKVNILGTLNVLLPARDNNVKKVIYASSSVYGDTPTLPKTEDVISHPRSPYALTKLAGEYYYRISQQIYSLPTIYLRYFNVYGSRRSLDLQYTAVIPIFIARVSQNKHSIIYRTISKAGTAPL